MHPRLIEIPFIHLTIHSFGPMMMLGFLAGLLLIRRLSRRAGLAPEIITSAATYSLIIGVIGARIFFVAHHFDQLRGNLLGAVAVWRGGLEFLGGVVPAAGFLLLYLRFHKQPVRRYLDIMAMGLMMGLAFGRIGCFLNGCGYGRPTDLPWGIRFPYGSFAYISQINSNPARGRSEPQLNLPKHEYFSFQDQHGQWYPKPLEELTDHQQHEVTKGAYRCLPTHPTQLYASANALLICASLYAFWRRTSRPQSDSTTNNQLSIVNNQFLRPGSTVALTFILYAITRFILEAIRDDNPLEFASLTISQIISAIMFIVGITLLTLLATAKPNTPYATAHNLERNEVQRNPGAPG